MKTKTAIVRHKDYQHYKLEERELIESWILSCNEQFHSLISKAIKPVLQNKYKKHYSQAVIIQVFFPLIAILARFEHENNHIEHVRSELINWYNSMTTSLTGITDFQESGIMKHDSLFTKNNGGWGCNDDIDVITAFSDENPVEIIKAILWSFGSYLKEFIKQSDIRILITGSISNTYIQLYF